MYNYLKINAAFIFVCLVFGGITLASEPNDPNIYQPIAKVPSGFYLINSVAVKAVKDETLRVEWSLANNKKDLVVNKTEKTPLKKGEKNSDSIKEIWYKDNPNIKSKDNIEVLKLICPDKETLDKFIILELKQYAITPPEIKQPAIGDRLWKYETEQSTHLKCCKGLIFLKIDISSRSLSTAERLKIAEVIIKDNLPAQKTIEPEKRGNATEPNNPNR
jgi:hypothetical protein